MAPKEDEIVEISPQRERFFGCSGRMLKPCRATVEALIAEVPDSQLITTEQIRRELARRFSVEVTCPSDTKQALKEIANDPRTRVGYWRIVKANGELISYFPGGISAQETALRERGYALDSNGKTLKVKPLRPHLVPFD